MNRNQEYESLLHELEQPVPQLEGALQRAKTRRRKVWVLRPLTTAASIILVFVLLVNLCTPVAYACAQLPVLRELAQAVTFSFSLSQAVENNYVQFQNQEQTANGITVRVEYLIVDQKQLNVFFRVSGDADTYSVGLGFVNPEDSSGSWNSSAYWAGSTADSGQLTQAVLELTDADLPDTVGLALQVSASPDRLTEAPVGQAASESSAAEMTEFRFDVTIDQAKIAHTRTLSVNQSFTIDGQTFTLEQLELFPTRCRLYIREAEDNTAWLADLHFYLELPDGARLEQGSGLSAYGSTDDPDVTIYNAESPYFSNVEELHMVILGGELLDKNQERISIDLTGQTDYPTFPGGAELIQVDKTDGQLQLQFYQAEPSYNNRVLFTTAWTPEGTEASIDAFSLVQRDVEDDLPAGTYQTLYINNYTEDTILLMPSYSTEVTLEDSTELTIPLR